MNLTWYLHRLTKMSFAEVAKRLQEHLTIYHTQVKYRNPKKWPYSRFAKDETDFVFCAMPGSSLETDWEHYPVYNCKVDLTKPPDWYFTENKRVK